MVTIPALDPLGLSRLGISRTLHKPSGSIYFSWTGADGRERRAWSHDPGDDSRALRIAIQGAIWGEGSA